MAQVTEATIKMIEDHAARGEHAPLTIWEVQQLAYAWKTLQENDLYRAGYNRANDEIAACLA